MIGYTCKYAPVELLQALGGQCVFINENVTDFQGDSDIARLKGIKYARTLLTRCRESGIKELVITGCSDVSQRAYDVLRAGTDFRFLFYMDLPYKGDKLAVMQLKAELIRFMQEYSNYKKEDVMMEDFLRRFAFAFTSDAVMDDEECGGSRHLDMPAGQMSFDGLMEWYAEGLLQQEPCVRMGGSSEEMFKSEPETVFADDMAEETTHEEVEVSENIEETEEPERPDETLSNRGQTVSEALNDKDKIELPDIIFGGIDIGYSYTKVVLIDGSGDIIAKTRVQSTVNPDLDTLKAFGNIHDEMGIEMEGITAITACGDGTKKLGSPVETESEADCLIKGALKSVPGARTIVDLGGRGTRAYHLGRNGELKSTAKDDGCASAAGIYLENAAKELQVTMEEFFTLGDDWEEDISLQSGCAVFDLSEIRALAVANEPYSDIIHAVDKVFAVKAAEVVTRMKAKEPVVVTGGAALDSGALKTIEDKVHIALVKADDPEYGCAYGAAIFACESGNEDVK